MKYFLSILFAILSLNAVHAQEKHFVFIQTDNQLPFYVSVNGKLYSSSATGYVIIPKLTDGEYTFTVGFAKNEFPEQTFTCVIDKKDLGYNLKNFPEKGWGLFNLQTLAVTMAGATNGSEVAKALNDKVKANTEPILSFDKPKKDTTTVVASKPAADTLSLVAPVVTVPSTTTADTMAKADAADVKKLAETKNAEGVTLSYVEGSGKKSDTIQVIIPSVPVVDTPAKDALTDADVQVKKEVNASTPVSPKTELKFLELDSNKNKRDSVAVVKVKEQPAVESGNCKNVATDEDYGKLRKKMANETTDEKMISEAKKYYRNKCFTTAQIRGLSTLFLSDEGRYKFFDASYVSVADASEYATLVTEFIDPAYATRFKDLLQ